MAVGNLKRWATDASGPAVKDVAKATAKPWLWFLGVLLVISLFERLAKPAGAFNSVFDSAFNFVAFGGLVFAALHSANAFKLAAGQRRGIAVTLGIMVASFIGPLVGTVIVTLIVNDVDGSMWMLASPLLGVIVAVIAIVIGAVGSRLD